MKNTILLIDANVIINYLQNREPESVYARMCEKLLMFAVAVKYRDPVYQNSMTPLGYYDKYKFLVYQEA